MTATRYTHALACLTNDDPERIAGLLRDACTQVRQHPVFNTTNAMRDDPAVRLLAYRLALICELNVPNVGVYDRLVDACQELERRAKAGG